MDKKIDSIQLTVRGISVSIITEQLVKYFVVAFPIFL